MASLQQVEELRRVLENRAGGWVNKGKRKGERVSP
jgi:hypothetical protein